MKIYPLFLLLMIGLLGSFAAFGQQAAASNVTVYQDPQFAFSISYPKNWQPGAKSGDAMRLNVTSDAAEFASANLSVLKFTATGNFSSAEYVSEMLDKNQAILEQTAKKSLMNGRLISSGRTTLGSHPALYMITEGSVSSGEFTLNLKTYAVQMFSGGNLYTLTCGSDIDSFEKYYPQFQTMAASFKFDADKNKPGR